MYTHCRRQQYATARGLLAWAVAPVSGRFFPSKQSTRIFAARLILVSRPMCRPHKVFGRSLKGGVVGGMIRLSGDSILMSLSARAYERGVVEALHRKPQWCDAKAAIHWRAVQALGGTAIARSLPVEAGFAIADVKHYKLLQGTAQKPFYSHAEVSRESRGSGSSASQPERIHDESLTASILVYCQAPRRCATAVHAMVLRWSSDNDPYSKSYVQVIVQPSANHHATADI